MRAQLSCSFVFIAATVLSIGTQTAFGQGTGSSSAATAGGTAGNTIGGTTDSTTDTTGTSGLGVGGSPGIVGGTETSSGSGASSGGTQSTLPGSSSPSTVGRTAPGTAPCVGIGGTITPGSTVCDSQQAGTVAPGTTGGFDSGSTNGNNPAAATGN
jgi:hypothetical protein